MLARFKGLSIVCNVVDVEDDNYVILKEWQEQERPRQEIMNCAIEIG